VGVAIAINGFFGYAYASAVDADVDATEVCKNSFEGGFYIWATGDIELNKARLALTQFCDGGVAGFCVHIDDHDVRAAIH
jgi:hypothetical protein